MSDPKFGKNLSERELRSLSTKEFLDLIQEDVKDLDRAWKERRRATVSQAQHAAKPAQPTPAAAPAEPEKPARKAPAASRPKSGDVVQTTLLPDQPGQEAAGSPAPRRRRHAPAEPPAKPAGDSLAALLEEARSEMPPEDLDVFHSVTCCNMHLGDFPPIARVCCPFCGTWHKAGDHPRAGER